MALCTNQSSTNQVLEAMKWYFGKRHCRKITFVDDTAGDQDGLYFDLNGFDSDYVESKHKVLLSDGTTTSIAGYSGSLITVTYTANDDAETIAGLAQTAIEATAEVRTELVGAELEVQNQFIGAVTTEVNTNAAGLTFSVEDAGFGGYIGQVGESELTTTTDVVQLLDDAQGTVVQDEIITGHTAEITIPVREMTTQRWEDLVGAVSGSTVTINSKDITGLGTAKLYNSMFTYSGRLVGHPVRLANSDVSEDVTMLNTAPKMNSINFSGGSVQEAEFVFTSYKDASAPTGINLIARGDHKEF